MYFIIIRILYVIIYWRYFSLGQNQVYMESTQNRIYLQGSNITAD